MATRAGVAEYSTSPSAATEQRTVHPGQLDDRILGRRRLDPGVDLDPIRDHRGHDRPGQLAGRRIGLDLGQLALQDRGRGSLPEVRLEDRRQPDPPPGAQRSGSGRPPRCSPAPRLAPLRADAVDEDGDRPNLEPEQALDRAPDRLANLAARLHEVGAGPGDDPELQLDALLANPNHDRRARRARHATAAPGARPGAPPGPPARRGARPRRSRPARPSARSAPLPAAPSATRRRPARRRAARARSRLAHEALAACSASASGRLDPSGWAGAVAPVLRFQLAPAPHPRGAPRR